VSEQSAPCAAFSGAWVPDGTEPVVVGFDVAVTNNAGQLVSVRGFLDKVPDGQ
jgi:hypothetical protein